MYFFVALLTDRVIMLAMVPQFPGISWVLAGNSVFGYLWVAYTLSFERVLAQWEAGNFENPDRLSPSPWAG